MSQRRRGSPLAKRACLALCFGAVTFHCYPPQAGARTTQRAIGPAQRCWSAIRAAERAAGIPKDLLLAIGLVESGREDWVTGRWQSWPWTVNVAGQGYFYDTASQAESAVKTWQGQGVQSIDVGCLQVNLMHHPTAFATLKDAFDPSINAGFASRFLRELFEQTHDWTKAAAEYHSATPALGSEYERKILTVWRELRHGDPLGFGKYSQPESEKDQLTRAWMATLPAEAAGWNRESLGAIIRRVHSVYPR